MCENDSVETGSLLNDLSFPGKNTLVILPTAMDTVSTPGIKFLNKIRNDKFNIVAVSYPTIVENWVNQWSEVTGGAPMRGRLTRINESPNQLQSGTWSVNSLSNPSNVTEIGVEVSRQLAILLRQIPEHQMVTFCLDSVTAVLKHVDLQRVFRFLHIFTGRIAQIDAHGYYFISDEHDGEVSDTLTGLFDTICKINKEGNIQSLTTSFS